MRIGISLLNNQGIENVHALVDLAMLPLGRDQQDHPVPVGRE